MQPLSARGLIRFDVEDYITAESDDALLFMMGAMRRAGMPGSYGLVGKKVEALNARGRADILAALAEEPAVGFHSVSHSEHPTLAEELAPLDYAAGVKRFMERERPGVDAVARHVRAPQYFTQPGGNWVPEAAEALPPMGMNTYFTDSFNSYVVDLPQPYWYGEILLYSFPVINPRPFGLGLPDNLRDAIVLIEKQQAIAGDFMVMLHPTELVTREFWDVVNFPRGTTRQPLLRPPVRSQAEQAAALQSFQQYLQEISHFNIEWCNSATIYQGVQPREAIQVARQDILEAISRDGWGPMRVQNGHLSAAEALYGLAKLAGARSDAKIEVGYVAAPFQWEPQEGVFPPLPADQLRRAAHWIVESVEKDGRLPLDSPRQGFVLQQIMAALAQRTLSLTFLEYIKPMDRLHWDWPIFPENFRPRRLWVDARRLAWTLKPATSRTNSDDGTQGG